MADEEIAGKKEDEESTSKKGEMRGYATKDTIAQLFGLSGPSAY